MPDAVGSHLVGFDADQFRLVHMLVGQLHDPVRQGCREQHVEALVGFGQPTQEITDVLDEAEVEHAVGFIEHGDLDLIELENALFEVIDDAPGRADQDIDAGFDGPALLFVSGAAESQRNFESRMLAEDLGIVGDLYREFAGRRQDEDLRLPLPRVFALSGFCPLGLRQDPLVGGDQERSRLAGPRLRLAGDIAALEGDRERARLDRRAEFEARVGYAFAQAVLELERVESEFAQVAVSH